MSSSTVGVGDDDLVTGEAVALELPAAGIGMRVLSGFVDLVIAMVAINAGMFASVLIAPGADEAITGVITIVLLVLVVIVLPTTVETLTRGHSVGKLATGLRTVRDDAGPIGFRHALTRSLVGFVELIPMAVPALVSMLVSSKGKRLGDYAAGTYVVRERIHITMPPPPMMPPHLAAWAAGADIARLPDGLAMAVRQFLMRAPLLSPQSRTILGRQLFEEVLTYLAPAPPAGSHPELVLAAVIADRRRRDWIRLQRDAALRKRLIPADPLAPQ
jgi:uncharacterized RDD family membrane protein YckC